MDNYVQETERKDTNLRLTNDALAFLKEAASWSKYLSILGFIFLGITFIMAFFMPSFLSASLSLSGQTMLPGQAAVAGTVYLFSFLIVVVIYFYPIYSLFKFSIRLKKALNENDENILANSFRYLKNHYMYIGILTIICMLFYALIFILMLVMIAAIV